MQSEGWGSLSGDTCVPLGGAGGFLGLTSSVPSFTHSGTPAPPPPPVLGREQKTGSCLPASQASPFLCCPRLAPLGCLPNWPLQEIFRSTPPSTPLPSWDA